MFLQKSFVAGGTIGCSGSGSCPAEDSPAYARHQSAPPRTIDGPPDPAGHRPDSRSTHLSRAASRDASSFCQRRPPYPHHLLCAASTPARAEKRHAGSPCQPTDPNFHSQATRPAGLPAQCRASPLAGLVLVTPIARHRNGRTPLEGCDGWRVPRRTRVIVPGTTSHRNPLATRRPPIVKPLINSPQYPTTSGELSASTEARGWE